MPQIELSCAEGAFGGFGLVAPKGSANLKILKQALAQPDVDLPAPVRGMGVLCLNQIGSLTEIIGQLADELERASKTDDELRRLYTVPGIGPGGGRGLTVGAPDVSGGLVRALARVYVGIGQSIHRRLKIRRDLKPGTPRGVGCDCLGFAGGGAVRSSAPSRFRSRPTAATGARPARGAALATANSRLISRSKQANVCAMSDDLRGVVGRSAA